MQGSRGAVADFDVRPFEHGSPPEVAVDDPRIGGDVVERAPGEDAALAEHAPLHAETLHPGKR